MRARPTSASSTSSWPRRRPSSPRSSRKSASSRSAGSPRATRKGDLRAALAWEAFEKELEGRPPPPPAPASTREALDKEVEKARSDYSRERSEMEVETRRRRNGLKEKHRKAAGQGKVAATQKGDLKLALAWEELERELEPRVVNLALKSKVFTDGQVPENPRENLIDGDLTLPVDAHRYWFTGWARGKTHWARFDLGSQRTIRKVRFLVPVGTRWYRNGHEPLDYDLLLKLGGKIKERASVRGGQHQRTELSKDGQTQWVLVEFKKEVDASEVEFQCHKTSGGNYGPVVLEFEILGEE